MTRFELYWSIGQYISRKAAKDGWGTGTVAELSRTIQRKYPGMTGYYASNLWRMTQFYEMYCGQSKLAPLVRVFSWTHNLIILSRCKGKEEREFYLRLQLVRFITPHTRNHHMKKYAGKIAANFKFVSGVRCNATCTCASRKLNH